MFLVKYGVSEAGLPVTSQKPVCPVRTYVTFIHLGERMFLPSLTVDILGSGQSCYCCKVKCSKNGVLSINVG